MVHLKFCLFTNTERRIRCSESFRSPLILPITIVLVLASEMSENSRISILLKITSNLKNRVTNRCNDVCSVFREHEETMAESETSFMN